MNYDVFICSGCKKNKSKQDRCTCQKISEDNSLTVFNIYFASLAIKKQAISFLIDSVVDNKSANQIISELKVKNFCYPESKKKEIEENFKIKKIFRTYYIEKIR